MILIGRCVVTNEIRFNLLRWIVLICHRLAKSLTWCVAYEFAIARQSLLLVLQLLDGILEKILPQSVDIENKQGMASLLLPFFVQILHPVEN